MPWVSIHISPVGTLGIAHRDSHARMLSGYAPLVDYDYGIDDTVPELEAPRGFEPRLAA